MTGALTNILSRPRTVLTMMVVMVVAGIFTYINIPKEANPDIDVPVYYVSITQQGVSPKDAERLLVRPMETELRGLEGLKEITSIASQSHAGIILEFTIGTGIVEVDSADVLVQAADDVDQLILAEGRIAIIEPGQSAVIMDEPSSRYRKARARSAGSRSVSPPSSAATPTAGKPPLAGSYRKTASRPSLPAT